MPPFLSRVKLPPWAPDQSDQEGAITQTIRNVIPRADGWGPFPSFKSLTQSLPGACRGFMFARNPDTSVTIFAATATKLYALNNSTFTWVDVSAGFGSYASLSTGANWQFDQFANQVLAVQANVAPQVITLPLALGASQFAALGGSPPNAGFISIVNRFVVLSGISGQPYRVQWSDLGVPTTWTAGVGLADFQDLPDGGICYGVAGFDLFAVIFQSNMARLMTFAPGSPLVFTITKITGGDGNGLFAPYGWVIDQDNVFWLSQEGLKMMSPGGAPQPVGKEMIDRWIFANLDTGNLQLCLATTDPKASRFYMAFKSQAGQAGLFDTVLVYDWVLQRFGVLYIMGQYFDVMSVPGLTLENMDALTPGALTITGAASGTGGVIRLTVSPGTSGIATAQQQTVYGKWNVTQISGSAPFLAAINNIQNTANSAWGSWAITVFDGTHVELTGSVFAGAYTSGGILGGNIELLPFSLDSISTATLPVLAMFDAGMTMGTFSGTNLEAVIETAEYGTNEKRVYVNGFRTITDAPVVYGSVSYRDNPQAAYNYTSEVTIDANGVCWVAGGGIDTRYSRARIRIPSGTVWTYASAIEPDTDLTGSF